MKKYKYILYENGYTELVGGTIIMHKLCHLLNEYGCQAYMWRSAYESSLKTNKYLNTPTIHTNNFDDYIVVYNDTIIGNPLKAPNVVRWITSAAENIKLISSLHNEIVFFHGDNIFSRFNKYGNYDNKLTIYHINREYYKQTNFNKRTKTCFAVRKYRFRELDNSLIKNSIRIDNLPHEKVAKIFNECKYFYSYDAHTLYTTFAAMCGCIPIVIPIEGVSEKEWQPTEKYRYGVAYGFHNIEYAIRTRKKLFNYLDEIEDTSIKDTLSFIKKTQFFFQMNSKSYDTIEKEQPLYINLLKHKDKNIKLVVCGGHEGVRSTLDLLYFNKIKVDFLCDNDKNKVGKKTFGYTVHNPDMIFLKEPQNVFVVLIANSHIKEIVEQLKKYKNIESVYTIYGNIF